MPTFSSTIAHARAPFLLVPLLAALGSAQAADVTLSANSTTAQTIGTPSPQTLTINAGVALTVNKGTVAVTLVGNNAKVDNQGTINQTGTGRAIRDNTGVTGLVINNGSATNSAAKMLTADADVVQMNVSPASVTLNNYGQMISLNASTGGAQAVDFSAIASGANVVNNYAGAAAAGVRRRRGAARRERHCLQRRHDAVAGTTTGSSSDGVDLQNNNGGGDQQCRHRPDRRCQARHHGRRRGQHGTASQPVINVLGGMIQGDNGSGLNLDGFNGSRPPTVINHGSIIGNGITGDGDGVDVDGLVT